MGTFHDLGSPENYTIGGIRLFFNEVIASQEQGWLYLGNVVTGGFQPDITYLDHFTAKSGSRFKDRSVVQELAVSMNFTLDEPNVRGMNLFMLGSEPGAANVSAPTAVTDEVAVLKGTEWVYLTGKTATTVVVEDTGGTPYILDTDYEVGTYLGYTRIRRITTGGITDGEEVRVSYSYPSLVARAFNPYARLDRKGKAVIQGVSDTGNEFEWEVNSCQIKPDGEFTYNTDDWSQFSFIMEILDNSGNVPASPFGSLRHLGTDTNL